MSGPLCTTGVDPIGLPAFPAPERKPPTLADMFAAARRYDVEHPAEVTP